MANEFKLSYTGLEINEKLKQVETNTSNIDALSEEIVDLHNEVVIEAIEEKVNIYNPNLQTEETISPHYYVGGYPYSDTSFDNAYNATALIEIEPDTTYAIVLIPDVNGYATPWAGASSSLFFYDKDEVYVGGHKDKNSHVFTTPSNAKYIRFNYALARSITLEKLNARCVIVKGDSIPTEYIPYKESDVKKIKLKDEVVNLREKVNSLKRFAYSIENENEIIISQKYSNDMDIQFLLKRKGGNELFDFYKIYKVANANNVPIVHDVTDVTPFLGAGGDWHAPFQIKAVNNADGTQIDSKYFTGGNHQYNNSGSGSTATARSVSVDFIIDGIKMTSGNGYANEIVMKWANNVQGYNTTKEDGTGREILQERHTMTLKDGIFHSYVELIPLEDIICELWYGFQMFTTPYEIVKYIDGTNRTRFDVKVASNSGDKTASKVRFSNSAKDVCEIKVNTSYDLGKRNNVTGVKGIFSTDYGKAYFTIINDSLSMVSGGVYSLEGEYIFRHGNF